MKINPYVFRNYDIRGIVGEDLDAEKVAAIGKAYGTFLQRRKIRHAVVGHDCRLSGEEFQKAMIKSLTETGINVVDLGMVMTQMMYYGQYRFQTNGGVMITASHNPSNFNGFKLGVGYSRTTEVEEVKEIKKYVDEDKYYRSDKVGKVTKADEKAFTEDYYHDVLKRVQLKRKFKVVVDSGCGTTGKYVPELFQRAGCTIIDRKSVV